VRRLSIAFVLVLSCFLSSAVAQAPLPPDDPQMIHRTDDAIRRENTRLKAANKERTVRIKRDTDKLLELAKELKEYVDKTNENVMSVDVIKKAEQIEKLAKSVKERMKEDYRSPEFP